MSRFTDGSMEPPGDAATGPAVGPDEGRPAATADPLLDTVVGDVRIERVIGAGGMGRVYEGRQLRPARQVAVKVMRPGTVSASRLRRFEFEAELLGSLRHPGIAAIHASGSHPFHGESLPHFVMELVADGQPITRYCESGLARHADGAELPLRRKLVAAVAGRADAAALAGEGHDESRAARHADRAGEAEPEEPALEIAAELVLDVSRHRPLGGFSPLEPALEVLRHDLVERRLLGPAPLVTAGRRGASVRAASASRGKPCDRGDHGRTGRWTASVNIRTLSMGQGGSPSDYPDAEPGGGGWVVQRMLAAKDERHAAGACNGWSPNSRPSGSRSARGLAECVPKRHTLACGSNGSPRKMPGCGSTAESRSKRSWCILAAATFGRQVRMRIPRSTRTNRSPSSSSMNTAFWCRSTLRAM